MLEEHLQVALYDRMLQQAFAVLLLPQLLTFRLHENIQSPFFCSFNFVVQS